MKRIAVFSKSEYGDQLRLMPRNLFKYIRRVEDVRGEDFLGIITTYCFWENKGVKDGYDELYKRQPELFTIKE